MALVAISALPSSAVIASSDILPTVVSGTTKKITAGVLRTQLFAFAAADPLNIGPLTAVGNSTVTGALSGITTLTAAVVHATTPSVFDDTLKANTLMLGAGGGGIEEWFTNGPGTILVNFNGYLGGTTQFRSFIVYDGKNTNLFSIVGATGTVTISTGNLTFGAANSRIVPGATSFAIRNTTNAANNFVIDNSGNVIILGSITGDSLHAAGNATVGGLNILRAGNPITPGNGDKWITASGEFTQIAGSTKTVLFVNTQAGYTNPWTGGAANRATGYDATSVTLPQLAARVRAIQDDLTTLLTIGP